jgi:methyl-accepting chemotaxis protein
MPTPILTSPISSWFHFLDQLAIKRKLALMLFFPVVGMLYFSISGALEKNSIVHKADATLEFVKFSVLTSELVHELQKERGMTAGFIGSKGQKFSAQLSEHRESEVDHCVIELQEYLKEFDNKAYGPVFFALLEEARQQLDKLNIIRNQVDEISISSANAIGYFSQINADLLDAIGQIGKMAANASMANSGTIYINFLKGKELAGIERAIMTDTFSRDVFGPGIYRKFSDLVANQEVYFDVLRSLSNPAQVAFFDEKMSMPEVVEVERMRHIAFNNGQNTEGTFGVDPNYWFMSITKKIVLLKEVENILNGDIADQANSLSLRASNILIAYLTLLIFNILSAVFLVYVIGRGINLHLSHDRQTTLFQLMNLGLEPQPLDTILSRSLDLIYGISWMSLLHQGEIFLKDEKTGQMVLAVEKELPKESVSSPSIIILKFPRFFGKENKRGICHSLSL